MITTGWASLEEILDRALTGLPAQGYPVLDEDVARLSAYPRKHINVHGQYSFMPP